MLLLDEEIFTSFTIYLFIYFNITHRQVQMSFVKNIDENCIFIFE